MKAAADLRMEPTTMEILILILLLLIGSIWVVYSYHSRVQMQMEQCVRDLANRHIEALVKNRIKGLRYDDYGNVVSDRWEKDIQYFLKRIVVPRLSPGQLAALNRDKSRVATSIIETMVRAASVERAANLEFSESMTPAEFEHYCSKSLAKQGWTARVTAGTGDQGVDVVAEKGGRTLVVQCKKYASPVGNKAVQEIVAGREHERADFACVVSNAAFTRSAKELSSTTGVHLLHYMDLDRIDDVLGLTSFDEADS
jgi:restriction system protein